MVGCAAPRYAGAGIAPSRVKQGVWVACPPAGGLHMNRFVTLAAVTVMTATLVACGGSTPTSPSTLGGPSAAAAPAVSGDSSTNVGSGWTTRAVLLERD